MILLLLATNKQSWSCPCACIGIKTSQMQITSIDQLKGLRDATKTAVKIIDLKDQNAPGFIMDLSGFLNLEKLNVNGCRLAGIRVENLPNLKWAHVSGNTTENPLDLDFTVSTKLEGLSVTGLNNYDDRSFPDEQRRRPVEKLLIPYLPNLKHVCLEQLTFNQASHLNFGPLKYVESFLLARVDNIGSVNASDFSLCRAIRFWVNTKQPVTLDLSQAEKLITLDTYSSNSKIIKPSEEFGHVFYGSFSGPFGGAGTRNSNPIRWLENGIEMENIQDGSLRGITKSIGG